MLNLNSPISEVVKEYPIVGDFLLANDVDCVNCSVATCLVKDILEIHNFSKETQVEMQEYMQELVNGTKSELKVYTPLNNKEDYHVITNMLIDEHKLIMELIYITEYIVSKEDYLTKYKNEVDKIIHYFKYYADDFHHGKEEDVLFCLFEQNDILRAMFQEHEQGRDLRKRILEAGDNAQLVKDLLIEYTTMLKDHIYKEDNILFPYLDRNLTEENIEKINNELQTIDMSINVDIKAFIEDFNRAMFTL